MPKDKEEKLITYIKKFVDKHGFGPRSEDIINKFVPSSWSSNSSLFYHLGKLIDRRNLDKRADPEKAGDHYLRYFINKTYEKEAKKIAFASDLKEQELNTVNIPKEDMRGTLEWVAKHHMNFTISETGILKGNLFKGYKLSHSYENLFLNFWLEHLKEDIKFCDMLIQHPLGVHTPQLNKSDKYHLLRVLSYLIASRSSIKDVEKRGFNIILSYSPSLKEESEEERQERLDNRITAWRKDKGIKEMTEEDFHIFSEDYKKMRKLFRDITNRQDE